MSDSSHRLPFITKELLDYLRRLYPDRSPDIADTDRKIWFNCGAVQVVRDLERIHEEQHEKMLGG